MEQPFHPAALYGFAVAQGIRPIYTLRLADGENPLTSIVAFEPQRRLPAVKFGRAECGGYRPALLRKDRNVIIVVGNRQNFFAIYPFCDFCAQEERYVTGRVLQRDFHDSFTIPLGEAA